MMPRTNRPTSRQVRSSSPSMLSAVSSSMDHPCVSSHLSDINPPCCQPHQAGIPGQHTVRESAIGGGLLAWWRAGATGGVCGQVHLRPPPNRWSTSCNWYRHKPGGRVCRSLTMQPPSTDHRSNALLAPVGKIINTHLFFLQKYVNCRIFSKR